MAEEEGVLVERQGPVLRITLSRPQTRNALLPQDQLALAATVRDTHEGTGVRIIVIRGSAGSFCSGADITQVHLGYDALAPDWNQTPTWSLVESLREARVPVLSVVDGYALGLGMAIVAGSTLAVSSETASFGLPEVRYGLFPLGILPALSPVRDPKQVLMWALTGERVSAAEARKHGVVQHVVPEADLDRCADGLVDAIVRAGPGVAALGLEWLRMQREQRGAATDVTRWASMALVLAKDQVSFTKETADER